MIPPLAALLSWPLVSFAFARKMQGPLALLTIVIGGFLLLPAQGGLDLPMLPELNKQLIPSLSALLLLGMMVTNSGEGITLKGLLPKSPMALALIGLLIIVPTLTFITNRDAQFIGALYLPPLSANDALSVTLDMALMILPLVLGRVLLAHPTRQNLLLRTLCIAGFAYSFLALFEVRMSPQLSNMVYGFFPHSWIQHVRGGGYRPLVFLNHGLVLAIFLMMSVVATFGLMRFDRTRRRTYLMIGLWLMATLVLAKSLGALIIALGLMPLVLLVGVKRQLMIAAVGGMIFLSYPAVRSAGLIPLDRIETTISSYSAERAESLMVRLRNEDRMLERAQERPLFGWGGWGRSRVYNAEGRDITIADGAWIIYLGLQGWLGYIATFGLLVMPLVLLRLRQKRIQFEPETGLLALILVGNMVDLIPNSGLTPITWMIAGALWGRLELGRITETNGEAEAEQPAEALSRYTRQTVLIDRKAQR